MSKYYLNYLKTEIFYNMKDTSYIEKEYEFYQNLSSLKNYLIVDKTKQELIFSDYTDLTNNIYLKLNKDQVVNDNSVFTITDIKFIYDNTFFDSSILVFTYEDLLDETKQSTDYTLYLKIKFNKNIDLTDNFLHSEMLLLECNVPQLANELYQQINIYFINLNFITEKWIKNIFKEYIDKKYIQNISDNMKLLFTGQNHIEFINYNKIIEENLNKIIYDILKLDINNIKIDEQRYYIHSPDETILNISTNSGIKKFYNLFHNDILNYFYSHIDWTIDVYEGFTTDKDLYDIAHDITKWIVKNDETIDILSINFIRFLLPRTQIYNQEISLLHDNTIYYSNYIKFKVKNIIPDQTTNFNFILNNLNYDMSVEIYNYVNLPVKLDVIEYSNNLIQNNKKPYKKFIGSIFTGNFDLSFIVNKNELNYGKNTLRIFYSDIYSETYKDFIHNFVYAPLDIINNTIAKIDFYPKYQFVRNTFNIKNLLLHEVDNTIQAGVDKEQLTMYVSIPCQYELVYSYPIDVSISFVTTDNSGNLLDIFKYLEWDKTEMILTLEPTIEILENGSVMKEFILVFPYRFKKRIKYTSDILNGFNTILTLNIIPCNIDLTSNNFFNEHINLPFRIFHITFNKKQSFPEFSYKKQIKFPEKVKQNVIYNIVDAFKYTNSSKIQFDKFSTVTDIPISLQESKTVTELLFAFGFSENRKDHTISLSSSLIGDIKEKQLFIKNSNLKAKLITESIKQLQDNANEYNKHISNEINVVLNKSKYKILEEEKSKYLDEILNLDTTQNNKTFLKQYCEKHSIDITNYNEIKEKIDNDENIIDGHYLYRLKTKYDYNSLLYFKNTNIYTIENIFKCSYENVFYNFDNPKAIEMRKYKIGKQVIYDDFFLKYEKCLRYRKYQFTYRHNDYIFNKFYENKTITVYDGTEEQNLTPEIILSNMNINKGQLKEIYGKLQYEIYTSKTYNKKKFYFTVHELNTARLKVSLSSIDSENHIFTINIEPEESSNLQSQFKFKTINTIIDNDKNLKVTSLFSLDDLKKSKFNIYDLYGSNLKLSFKYINMSTMEGNISIIIEYLDEYGYSKQISIDIQVPPTFKEIKGNDDFIQFNNKFIDLFQTLRFFGKTTELSNGGFAGIWNDIVKFIDGFENVTNPDSVAQQLGQALARVIDLFKNHWKKYISNDLLTHIVSTYVMTPPSLRFSVYEKMALVTIPDRLYLPNKYKYIYDHFTDFKYKFIPSLINLKLFDEKIEEYMDNIKYNPLFNFILAPDTTYFFNLNSYLVYMIRFDAIGQYPVSQLISFREQQELREFEIIRKTNEIMKVHDEIESIILNYINNFQVKYNIFDSEDTIGVMNPIKIENYQNNLFTYKDENMLSGTFVEEVLVGGTSPRMIFTLYFFIPYEIMTLSIDATATGIYEINFMENTNTMQNTGEIDGKQTTSNIVNLGRVNKIKVQIVTPDFIPKKYLDVKVKRL